MITYAESKNKKPFDWNAFLIKAQSGGLSGIERDAGEFLASRWVTCACGRQCEKIPRHEWDFGRPVDEYLEQLGISFYGHIVMGQWSQATETLQEIEERSAEILSDL